MEHGFGLCYQAAVIVKAVHDMEGSKHSVQGAAIGRDESLCVLGPWDDVRKWAGITYDLEFRGILSRLRLTARNEYGQYNIANIRHFQYVVPDSI